MVDRPTTLSYADLAELPIVEQYVTIACVSNEVGGNLVGNAKWTGVRLREVLDIAGVQSAATQLVGRSVDGWTAGMPTEWVMDPAREPMIALKMNDEPLPRAHGFPARLIVPGLYGYVSATKWLAELELTTWEGFDGYWVPLGWSKEGPILTQSRIDVPRSGGERARRPRRDRRRRVGAGPRHLEGRGRDRRGVAGVPALDADLRATWVQWTYAWDAAASGAGLAHDRGPRDRRRRRGPDRRRDAARPRTAPAATTASPPSSDRSEPGTMWPQPVVADLDLLRPGR